MAIYNMAFCHTATLNLAFCHAATFALALYQGSRQYLKEDQCCSVNLEYDVSPDSIRMYFLKI